MTISNFISQQDALKLLDDENVSFVDASWYLPAQNRNGFEEFQSMRIPGAVYFDINEISDQESDLPHMLASPTEFAQKISALGISKNQKIIVYDGPGLFSSARVWWTLKVMGAQNVVILEGGFDAWKKATLPVETGNPNPPTVKLFEVDFNPLCVVDEADVLNNINSKEAILIDARSIERFEGRAEEPRAGMRSGHIPGSKALPFTQLINQGKLKPRSVLDDIFNDLGIYNDIPVITSCGSGVTAAILILALEETGRKNHRLYDGSWAQWGRPNGPEIAT